MYMSAGFRNTKNRSNKSTLAKKVVAKTVKLSLKIWLMQVALPCYPSSAAEPEEKRSSFMA